MKKSCVYMQVMVQMYLQGMDSHDLAQKANISYPTLRRKLRGDGGLGLEEAKRIRQALGCVMPLEELFERKDDA